MFAAGRDGRAGGGRAGGRANGQTSGRTDGGTAVAARGGGCGLCDVILLLRRPGHRPRRLNRLNRDSPAAPAEARAPRRRHRRRRRSVPSTPMVSPPPPPPLTHPPTSLRRRERFGGRVILNRPIYGTAAAGSKHEGALKSCHLFWFPRHDTTLVQPGGGAADLTGGAADSTRGRLRRWAMTAAR
jgi:hypothetical protein